MEIVEAILEDHEGVGEVVEILTIVRQDRLL